MMLAKLVILMNVMNILALILMNVALVVRGNDEIAIAFSIPSLVFLFVNATTALYLLSVIDERNNNTGD